MGLNPVYWVIVGVRMNDELLEHNKFKIVPFSDVIEAQLRFSVNHSQSKSLFLQDLSFSGISSRTPWLFLVIDLHFEKYRNPLVKSTGAYIGCFMTEFNSNMRWSFHDS